MAADDPVTLHVRGEGGAEFDMDVPTTEPRREIFYGMVAKGQIVVLEGELPPQDADEAPADVDVDGELSAPAHSALKADWVDFAVSQGAGREDAEAMTKDELIETFGEA